MSALSYHLCAHSEPSAFSRSKCGGELRYRTREIMGIQARYYVCDVHQAESGALAQES